MRILFVAAEVSPFAKVGGLADVAGSLPRALKALGHDVRIAMPAYRMVEYGNRWPVDTVVGGLHVEVGPGWSKRAYLRATSHKDVPVYLVGTDEWFCHVRSSETVYEPGSDQYLFFARATLECLSAAGWIPEIVHANDWQTGFLPVFLREQPPADWADTAGVFTIHNLGYQGSFGPEILDKVGLPQSLFNLHRLEAHGRLNFLKAGCVYADQTNTVSRTYAEEIRTQELGYGLDGLMRHLHSQGRLSGILNGIDTQEFDPETDSRIPARYSVSDLEGKAECRRRLLQELNLKPLKNAPLAAVVSRLSDQKGFDLIAEAAQEIAALPMQIVVLAVGSPYFAAKLRHLEAERPDRFRFVERFDTELAQRLYAGADAFLMPSAYEPCGLGQLIALRYGTVPVVRRTGGLADTVFEGDNGFAFDEYDARALADACRRAWNAFQDQQSWREMVRRGMAGSYGWDVSAARYESLYEGALRRRAELADAS